MPLVTRHCTITVFVLALVALLGAGVFLWSGIYNIGADDAHTRPVYSMLEMLRDRSITARSKELHPPPDLNDPALIRQGAGNYDSMCTSCHLGPGMEENELSRGLYPKPPNLSAEEIGNPAHHFWVIKHGIKASGMPAWGRSMQDQYIWGMVAFLQQLPKLSPEQYLEMVASSGGHSHGGGETMSHVDGEEAADHHAGAMEGMQMNESKPHSHPAGMPAHDDAPHGHDGMEMGTLPMDESKPHSHPPGTPAHRDNAPASIEHRHADGTVESHPAPTPAPAKAGDGHDHEH